MQLNGANKLKLNVTSPGNTDSLATQGPAVTVAASKAYYLAPESVAVVGTLNAAGTASGIGWALVPSEPNTLVPLNTDGWSLSSGSFTVQVTVARDTALTSADQTCTFTVILFRANASATTFAQELGRQASASVTITTTKTDFPVTVTTAAASFLAGDTLWLEIFASAVATSTTGSTASYSTNSTTGCRITATTASYSTNFNKSLSDTVLVGDTPARRTTLARSMSDTAPISDSAARLASFPRALSDTLATVADSVNRVFAAQRKPSDTLPIADSLTRGVTNSRTLADSVPVAEALTRNLIYTRALSDTLAAGGGGTVTNNYYRPVLIFEE